MVLWDDVLFGVLTGGAYNAAKAAAQAGDAAGKIGDDLGKSVTITTEKALALIDEITGFVTDLEQLLVVKRLTPRDINDLWDEDKERLTSLKNLEASYEAQYKKYGGPDTYTTTLVQSIVDMMMGRGAPVLGQLAIKILTVRKAINDIYFNEPGVIPETIYQVKGVIERFHTLEQPRIETLMDITTDIIVEGNEILVEVKKLFIIRQYKEKAFASLSPEDKARHIQLSARKIRYDDLIAKNVSLVDSLQKSLTDLQIDGPVIHGGAVNPVVKSDINTGGIHAAPDLANVKLSMAGVSATQGMLANINTQVKNSQVVALLGASNSIEGRLTFYEREQLKVDKSLFTLTHELVEVPGVIPNTLEDVHLSIKRFRTEEQPRIEKILDSSNNAIVETNVVLESIDQTVLELKKLLVEVNTILLKILEWFDFFSKYRIPLLVGCGLVVVLAIAILIMVLVVLVKIAFF